jgi:predicted DNA-binding WGR domain protein
MSEPQLLERVVLQCTDLTGKTSGCTKLGSNKFWIGEVLKNSDGTCDFKCRWGSTGTPGSTKGSKFGVSEVAAFKVLNTKVKQKTSKKKGYTRVDTRSQDEEVTKASAKGVDLTNGNGNAKTPVPKAAKPSRTFHHEVSALLGLLYGSTSQVVRSGLSATAGATEGNPIGNLSDAQLDIGGGILDEIADMLNRSGINGGEVPLLRDGTPRTDVIDLTNRYLSNIPRAIDRKKRGPKNLHKLVVSSQERLEKERKFLQLLRDAHLTQGVFQAVATASRSTDKVGIQYDGLGCDIDYCAPGSSDHKHVSRIFTTAQSQRNANWWSGGRTRLVVKRVWKFTRKGTDPRFDAFAKRMSAKRSAVGNIWAWHGTRTENLMGIGKNGLLMPENLPRGVHVSGKAFGRGIYHAPAWNGTKTSNIGRHQTDGTNGALKAMNYTSATGAYYGSGNSSNTGFMFLQEVALGRPEVRTSPCWDKRRPDRYPEHDFIYACAGGCSTLTHDELVTFDEDAQLFRYLVEIGTGR